jgi:hypothetical protein
MGACSQVCAVFLIDLFDLNSRLVPGGYSAVLFNKYSGTRNETYGEGMHFKWPFLEVPILFDLRATARYVLMLHAFVIDA